MFWATNQMVQKMLASKDGQDGSLTTKWNFAQRQNSSNPVMNKAQGSSTKTEVIPFCVIINVYYATLSYHNLFVS